MNDASPTATLSLQEALDEMLADVQRASKNEWAPTDSRPWTPLPYPGLSYFTSETSEYFNGRTMQIKRVLGRLSKSSAVLILGGSGCGKSSLIRGGVLPELALTGQIPNDIGPWSSLTMRPERNPLRRLRDAFLEDYLEPALAGLREKYGFSLDAAKKRIGDDQVELGEALVGALRGLGGQPLSFDQIWDSSRDWAKTSLAIAIDAMLSRRFGPNRHPGLSRLRDCVAQIENLSAGWGKPRANLLLVIDQFEELFRSEMDAGERQRIIALIKDVVDSRREAGETDSPGVGVIVALVMRSEDLHRCAEEPVLADIANTSQIFVDWLDRVDLRKAIVEPAQFVFRSWLNIEPYAENSKFPFDDGLVKQLVKEALMLQESLEHKGDHLPLLQHGLRCLWLAACGQWRAKANDARQAGRKLERDELIIKTDLYSQITEHAKTFVEQQYPAAKDMEFCGLQWLLAEDAEKALSDAEERFATGVSDTGADELAANGAIPPELAIRAAFCEMASLDENRRYYRRFRTADEICLYRFPAAGGTHWIEPSIASGAQISNGKISADNPDRSGRHPLANRLDAALNVFENKRLLTERGSGAWDVTHEALLRNWPRVADWVEEDTSIQEAVSEAIRIGRVRSDQTKIVMPVFGRSKTSAIYPDAWFRRVREGVKYGHASQQQIAVGTKPTLGTSVPGTPETPSQPTKADRSKLWWSYHKAVWRPAFMPVSLGTLFLIAGLAFWWWNSSRMWALNSDLLRAEAIAANASSLGDARQQLDVRQRATELMVAVDIWDKVDRDLTKPCKLNDPLACFIALTGQASKQINDLELAERRIDDGVRAVLGGTYLFLNDDNPTQPDPNLCRVVPEPKQGQDAKVNGDSLEIQAGSHRVFIDDGMQLRLQVQDNRKEWMSAKMPQKNFFPARLNPGEIFCLSNDSHIFTVSDPAQPPQIYMLEWYHAGTQPMTEPVVYVAPLYFTGYIPTNNPQSFSQPKINYISPRNVVTGERVVRFDLESEDSPHNHFLAKFYEGYSAPILLDHNSSPIPECLDKRNCAPRLDNGMIVQKTIRQLGNLALPYINISPPNQLADGTTGSSLPRATLPYFGDRELDGATVGEYNNLIFRDNLGGEWELRLFTDAWSVRVPLEDIIRGYKPDSKSWSDVCRQEGCDGKFAEIDKRN